MRTKQEYLNTLFEILNLLDGKNIEVAGEKVYGN